MNIVPTVGGDFFLFVNEQSLLTVTVPMKVQAVFQLFVARVANILAMLTIPEHLIDGELSHFQELKIGKTCSRVVLGSMNDIAFQLQGALEGADPANPLSLSDFEFSDFGNAMRSTRILNAGQSGYRSNSLGCRWCGLTHRNP